MTQTETRLRNVSFLPLKRLKMGYFSCGVFDEAGRQIMPWPLLASFDSRFPYPPKRLNQPIETDLKGQFVYAGGLNSIFGHLLCESGPNMLAAASTIRSYPDAKVLFHVEADEDLPSLTEDPLGQLFLEAADLDPSRITYIKSPIRVEDVIIPKPAFSDKFTYAEHMLPLLDTAFPTITAGPAQKLFMSRRTLSDTHPRIADEARVARRFEEAGYTIIDIQDHPLETQIAMVKGVTAMAGPQGSALHWSLFAPHVTSVISLGWKSPLQHGICALRGQRCIDPRGWMHKPIKAPRSRVMSDKVLERALRQANDAKL